MYVAVRHKLRPKQWRTVGVADSCITSIFQRDIYELTACPRAEQIPCICFELTGHKPCLKVVCLWYVSGIVSLSLHLSSWMGIYLRTCSCDVFPWSRSISDAKVIVSDLFFESGDSIPRSLTDDHLVWIWCSLSFLLPATLKIVANSLSMFYRCLRFRLLIGVDILFDYCC